MEARAPVVELQLRVVAGPVNGQQAGDVDDLQLAPMAYDEAEGGGLLAAAERVVQAALLLDPPPVEADQLLRRSVGWDLRRGEVRLRF